jgi:hypothetical protein
VDVDGLAGLCITPPLLTLSLPRTATSVRPTLGNQLTLVAVENLVMAMVKRFDRGILDAVECAPPWSPTSSVEAPRIVRRPEGLPKPSGSQLTCSTCGELFGSPQGMGSHRRWCTGAAIPPSRPCSWCNKDFHINGLAIHEKFCRIRGQPRLNFSVRDSEDESVGGIPCTPCDSASRNSTLQETTASIRWSPTKVQQCQAMGMPACRMASGKPMMRLAMRLLMEMNHLSSDPQSHCALPLAQLGCCPPDGLHLPMAVWLVQTVTARKACKTT